MTASIHVLQVGRWPLRETGTIISTVSKDNPDLSPFHLGPCDLYGDHTSKNMENAWQFAKVYPEYTEEGYNPYKGIDPKKSLDSYTIKEDEYFAWATKGWNDQRAHRYPKGRGRKPLFSLWDGERLGYVDARKTIYGPLYAEAVQKTEGWKKLKAQWKEIKKAGGILTLLDYDAYDHNLLHMTLTDVLNHPTRKMGHAFVLAMLLTKDPALNQMKLR